MESGDLNAIFPQLPPYEAPPKWIPPKDRIQDPNYNNDLQQFLPRNVVLKRTKASEALGFNVRGGKEHNFGIYVSKVMPDSEADRLGLKEGDQILTVNDADFENMDHADAVKVLKMNTTINMTVRFFPYGYERTYDKNRHQSSSSNQSPSYR